MNAKKTPPTGKVPLAAIGEVLDGIKTVAECVRDIQKEHTEQIRLRESARVEVERIHAMRDVLLVKLAEASPFKALNDVAAARAALSEKGKEWQF